MVDLNNISSNELPSYSENTTSNGTGKDITNEVEVDKKDVDMYSIEELAPSSTPLTIAYMEVYRTNELEYVPYISPYNVGCSSSSDSTNNSDSSTDSSTDSNSTDSSSDSSSDSNSSDSSSNNDSSSGSNSTS